MPSTLNEIQRDGLIALREKLGVAGMIRFLQQFENGSGNYATERHAWVDRQTFESIEEQIANMRRLESQERSIAGNE